MAKTQYDLIWKEGSFFERGHWKLVPKDSGGGAAFAYLIIICLVVFITLCLILTLPLWVSLTGFSMVKQKRHYAGFCSLATLAYFLLDIQKNWISGLLIFGRLNSSGTFTEGVFGEKSAIFFYIINGIGALMALLFIVESELFNKNSDTSNSLDEDSTFNINKLIFIGLAIIITGFGFYSISTKNHKEVANNTMTPVTTDSKAVAEVIDTATTAIDTTTIAIDTLTTAIDSTNSDLVDSNENNQNRSTETNYSLNSANNYSNNINDVPEANENPNHGVFTVNTDRCYFYLTPTTEYKLKAYITAGEKGTFLAVKDGFVYTVFTNSNGVTSKGWLLISEINISN
jgi:hypothetical protein